MTILQEILSRRRRRRVGNGGGGGGSSSLHFFRNRRSTTAAAVIVADVGDDDDDNNSKWMRAVCLSHGNKDDNTADSLILMGYENTAKTRFRKSSNPKVVYLSKLGILNVF
jgi:hypothetical protein